MNLIAVAILALAAVQVVTAYLFLRHVSGEPARQASIVKDVVASAMIYLRSSSPDEAIASEVKRDVAQEVLKDAEIKAAKDKEAAEAAMAPRWASTDDGRRIDLREWELT